MNHEFTIPVQLIKPTNQTQIRRQTKWDVATLLADEIVDKRLKAAKKGVTVGLRIKYCLSNILPP